MTTWSDVAVLGLGPAGRATAAACAAVGLRVTAVDPAPHRPWSATYGAWSDELGPDVPAAVRVDRPHAWTTRRHVLDRPYTVIDTARLQEGLSLDGVHVLAGQAATVHGHGVRTTHGEEVRARLVLDARGAPAAGRVQQTAHGVVVTPEQAAPLLDGAGGLFMDWREPCALDGAAPSFLYAVPLDDERVLLEETCLAGRPALSLGELRRRLELRLPRHGVRLRGDEPVERVRFALDSPLPGSEWRGAVPEVVRIGAAAPLVHPATGYSVAASLELAPSIASAAASTDPARAVQSLVWSPSARTVHALRRRGLQVLLGLPPARVPEFFAAFLELAPEHQHAYLSRRAAPVATGRAMAALLPHLSWPMRRELVLGRPPAPVVLSPRSSVRTPGGR